MATVYIILFLAGLLGGFIAGMAGIGTGFLLVAVIPIALEHLGVPAQEIVKCTIANTLFATMCSSFMNNLVSIRKGHFYLKESLWIGLTAICSAVIFMQLAVMRSTYSKELYNAVIIAFLVYVVIRSILKLRKGIEEKESVTNFKLTATGFSGGLVAAFTGLGGGSIMMPMLNLWLKIDIKKAKNITYATIFAIAAALTIINVVNEPATQLAISHTGYIIFPVALPLAAGVILASPFGVITSYKVNAKTISYVFLSVIVLVIIRKSFELMG